VEDSHLAASAVDGDGSTRWASAAAEPEWLTIPLAQPIRRLCHVRIKWHSQYASEYSVQLSSDGQKWRAVLRVTAGEHSGAGWVQLHVPSDTPAHSSSSSSGSASAATLSSRQPSTSSAHAQLRVPRRLVIIDDDDGQDEAPTEAQPQAPLPEQSLPLLGRTAATRASSAVSMAAAAEMPSAALDVGGSSVAENGHARYVRLVCSRRAIRAPAARFSLFEIELFGVEIVQPLLATHHLPPPPELAPPPQLSPPPPLLSDDSGRDRFSDLLSPREHGDRFDDLGRGAVIEGVVDHGGVSHLEEARDEVFKAARAMLYDMLVAGGPVSTVVAAVLLAALLLCLRGCCQSQYDSSRSMHTMTMQQRSMRLAARSMRKLGEMHLPHISRTSPFRSPFGLSSRPGYRSVSHWTESDLAADDREESLVDEPPPAESQVSTGTKSVCFALNDNTYDDDEPLTHSPAQRVRHELKSALKSDQKTYMSAVERHAWEQHREAEQRRARQIAQLDQLSRGDSDSDDGRLGAGSQADGCSDFAGSVVSSAVSSTLVNNTLYVPVVAELDTGGQISLSVDYDLARHRHQQGGETADPNSLLLVPGLKKRLAFLAFEEFGKTLPCNASLVLQAEMDDQGSLLTLSDTTPLETYVDCRRLRATTVSRLRRKLLKQEVQVGTKEDWQEGLLQQATKVSRAAYGDREIFL